MALLASLVRFSLVLVGITNRELVDLVASLLDQPYSGRQATYDLRRLRRRGLIRRVPYSQRYQLTPFGRRTAVLFTKAHGRVLPPASHSSTPWCRTTSPSAAHSPVPGDSWTAHSTPSSIANYAQPELDQSVNLSLGKPSLQGWARISTHIAVEPRSRRLDKLKAAPNSAS